MILNILLQIEHEETCEFRPYSCPCPGASCKWQGSLEQVKYYLMKVSNILTLVVFIISLFSHWRWPHTSYHMWSFWLKLFCYTHLLILNLMSCPKDLRMRIKHLFHFLSAYLSLPNLLTYYRIILERGRLKRVTSHIVHNQGFNPPYPPN